MGNPKLFVFMVDALCESDVAYMRTLKNFGWMLENGALVREMLPVYPSFTYPCHVSIMTGCYPEKHGIPHNEQVKAGVHPVPWYISRKLVQKKFFAEYAKERGFSTCLVNWPVSAGADVDINLPMCVPMGYRGDNPRQFYEGVSSPEVLDRYFWKYGYMLCGCNKVLNGSLDDFWKGFHVALDADFQKIKLNAVLIGGFNDDEILPLAELTRKYPVDVRFIEMMPMCDSSGFGPEAYIPFTRVLEALPEAVPAAKDGGVAKLFHLPGALGNIGLISPVSAHFCGECNRIRLTADGKVKPCLHSNAEYPLKGLDFDGMKAQLEAAILGKPQWHGDLDAAHKSGAGRNMNQIGG